MGRLFEMSILTLLFAIVNAYVLIDEWKDREKSVDSVLRLMEIGLQEFSEGIERMVMKRLEGVENIVEEKIKEMIGNFTRNTDEDRSTDQNETFGENLLFFIQTKERQKIESPTTRLSSRVDEKISNSLITMQIKQRFFRQEMVSVTARLFGKLEKIGDVLSATRTKQQILRKEIKSLSSNLSENVDKKISDKFSSSKTEQNNLKQIVVSITSNLVEKVNEKISKLIETSKATFITVLKSIEIKAQEIDELQISLNAFKTHYNDERLKREDLTNLLKSNNESLYKIQTDQQLLRGEMVFKTANLSKKVDEKLSHLNSTFQTGQQQLSYDMLSVKTNLSETVDNLVNQEISNLEKAFDGLSGQLQNKQVAEIDMLESILNKTNQTLFVCNTKIEEEIYNKETNLRNVFHDEMKNVSLILENESAKSRIVLDKIRNTSLIKQLSSGEAFKVMKNVKMISQSLLKVHEIIGTSCTDIFRKFPSTKLKDGVYNIIDPSLKKKAVYCDMTTDSGGWTVIQRRVNGSVDFNRNWTEYKNGFGFADHEYWIGNDMLHILTSQEPQKLRVDMERFNGEKAYALYTRFSVADEASKYSLKVNGYSGNAGDSLRRNNNMNFSTPDQENDGGRNFHCASYYSSGGWFDDCGYVNPNGQYIDIEKTYDWIRSDGAQYIFWYHWKKLFISLKTMKLMIRPTGMDTYDHTLAKIAVF